MSKARLFLKTITPIIDVVQDSPGVGDVTTYVGYVKPDLDADKEIYCVIKRYIEYAEVGGSAIERPTYAEGNLIFDKAWAHRADGTYTYSNRKDN